MKVHVAFVVLRFGCVVCQCLVSKLVPHDHETHWRLRLCGVNGRMATDQG